MILTVERRAWTPGYEVPVKRALWERIQTCGVPRLWAAFWSAGCLFLGMLTMVGLGFAWLLLPVVLWLVGHGVLIGLTLWDVHFDDVAIAQLTRRYQGAYDAG